MRNFVSKKMRYSRKILTLTLFNTVLRRLRILRSFFVIDLDLIAFYSKLTALNNDFKITKYKSN